MTKPRSQSLTFALLSGAALALSACGSAQPSTYEDAARAFEDRQYRIANAHIFDLIENDNADDRTRLLQVKLMLEMGNGDRAMAVIDQLPESVLGGADRRVAIAHAQILQGYPHKTAAMYEPLALEDYTEQDFRMVLWALREVDEPEEFAEGMDAALELFPDSAVLNALAAEQLFDAGLVDEGGDFALAAFEADEDNFEARMAVGRLAILEEELEIAIEHYTRANKLYPDAAVPLANIAGLQLDMGLTNEAGVTLDRALKQHPGFPMLQWQSARHLLEVGNVTGAREAMEQARRSFADNPEFVLLTGRIEQAAGNRRLAVDAYRRFLDEVGGNAEVEAMLAQIEG
ncbi:MAG: tetratricopeptide repeat protein [Pseudomonadota bacterium]